MYECTVDSWDGLQHVLETLTVPMCQLQDRVPGSVVGIAANSPQIMAVLQAGAGIQHNVDLNIQLVPRVICLQPLNLTD